MLLNPFWPSPFPHLINDPFLKQFYLNLLLWWITTELMRIRGLQGVTCHSFFVSTLPKEKRFLGMSGMWRSNWHKSANLHRPPLPNHFIVLSGGNVALFASSHETSLFCLLGGFLRDKEAAAATSFFEGSPEMRHHCINTSKWYLQSFQMVKTAHWQVDMPVW